MWLTFVCIFSVFILFICICIALCRNLQHLHFLVVSVSDRRRLQLWNLKNLEFIVINMHKELTYLLALQMQSTNFQLRTKPEFCWEYFSGLFTIPGQILASCSFLNMSILLLPLKWKYSFSPQFGGSHDWV